MAIITEELVSLERITAAHPREGIEQLAGQIVTAGRASDAEPLIASAWAREEQSATGMPGGFAIPHCRTSAVSEPTLAFARLGTAVDFGSSDGPADLVFLIAVPETASQDHLKILSALATGLMQEEFVAALRSAGSASEVVALIDSAVAPTEEQPSAEEPAAREPATEAADSGEPVRRLVAVTACPTGIAHTYMAADALKQAAQARGIDLQVETQGSAGSTPLPASAIADAEAVIFAVDVDVRDKGRQGHAASQQAGCCTAEEAARLCRC